MSQGPLAGRAEWVGGAGEVASDLRSYPLLLNSWGASGYKAGGAVEWGTKQPEALLQGLCHQFRQEELDQAVRGGAYVLCGRGLDKVWAGL